MQSLKLELEKIGWIYIAETVSSFPWPGLASDVHLSFGYSPNSETINLHLTRNVKGVAPGNKPYIRIAEWLKTETEEMARLLFCRLWEQMWVPFDMRKYQHRSSPKGRHARYCSITGMMKPGKEHRIHRQLKAHLLQYIKRKKRGRHIVCSENLIATLERQALRPQFLWEMIHSFRRVPRQFAGRSEIGCLYARDFSGMVIQIQGQWFRYNIGANLNSVLQSFFEPSTFKELQEKVMKAIAIISTANTKQETDPFNDPIELMIIREEESLTDKDGGQSFG